MPAAANRRRRGLPLGAILASILLVQAAAAAVVWRGLPGRPRAAGEVRGR